MWLTEPWLKRLGAGPDRELASLPCGARWAHCAHHKRSPWERARRVRRRGCGLTRCPEVLPSPTSDMVCCERMDDPTDRSSDHARICSRGWARCPTRVQRCLAGLCGLTLVSFARSLGARRNLANSRAHVSFARTAACHVASARGSRGGRGSAMVRATHGAARRAARAARDGPRCVCARSSSIPSSRRSSGRRSSSS